MSEQPEAGEVVRISRLSPRKPHPFALVPGPAALRAIAADLGLSGLRKLRFAGRLTAEGSGGWRLDAHLGATVTQPCVVSLAPVTTRIEEEVIRRFVRDWPAAEDAGEEIAMPDDETAEPLAAEIDLRAVMTEALALALPPYPRAPGAEAEHAQTLPRDADPIGDAPPRPFAALAGLKKKLDEGGG